VHAMQAHGGSGKVVPLLLTSAVHEGGWPASHLC